MFFFFNDTATTEIYTLSLHDALPILCRMTFPILASLLVRLVVLLPFQLLRLSLATPSRWTTNLTSKEAKMGRSEEGSAGMPRPISYAVFCLKKKNQITNEFRVTLKDY